MSPHVLLALSVITFNAWPAFTFKVEPSHTTRNAGLPIVAALRGGEQATAATVELFTTPGCTYCRKAKALFKRLKVQYSEIDISESAELREEMIGRAGAATLPQIFVAGVHVGGATELLAEYDAGALATRFNDAKIDFTDLSAELAAMDAPPPPPPPEPIASRGPNSVLNVAVLGAPVAGVEEGGAAALSTSLQKRMLALMDEHLSEDGARVDYAALRVSAAFAEFCDAVGALQSLSVSDLGPNAPLAERKAFWINLYNVLVLHSTAVLGAPATPDERSKYFSGQSGAAYRVGGQRLSLDDIEHGVLRGNSPTVGGATLFSVDDPRLPLSLPLPVDPRLHLCARPHPPPPQ